MVRVKFLGGRGGLVFAGVEGLKDLKCRCL